MEKLLDVENVSISFIQYTQGLNQRDLKVITDLTLDISEGEILAVLGSSGSGKSLLAHAIFGILPENANLNGKIKYKGKELTQEDKEEIRGKDIVLVPQSVNFLDPLMKISDQAIGHVETDAEKKEKKQKQREIFEHYNLGPEVDDMYPFQLSGGMARRVLVSTALLSDPKLVVADEPTPGLDQKTVEDERRWNRSASNHTRHPRSPRSSRQNRNILLRIRNRNRTQRRFHRRRRKPPTPIHKSTLQSTACKRIRTNQRTPAAARRNTKRMPILRQMRNEIRQMQGRTPRTHRPRKQKSQML